MLANAFQLIPAIGGVLKIAVEYSCVHARFEFLVATGRLAQNGRIARVGVM
jgi:hypothetical protein